MEVDQLRVHWSAGRGYPVGEVVYALIPSPERPAWAGDILDLAISLFETVPPAVRVVAVAARKPEWWPQAHGAFSLVRRLTLAEDKSHVGGAMYGAMLLVAENTAKVVYNASGEPAPFDADCGAALVSCLRHLTAVAGSPEFEQRAWGLLGAWLRRVGGHAEPGVAPDRPR